MKYSETIEIIELLRRAFPKFIQTSELDRDIVVLLKNKTALWHECLEPYPVEVCRFAVIRLINELKYPPAISEVIDRIKECLNADDGGALEAWNALSHAASNATVTTPKEFESLPYEVQRFCGSLQGLVSLGLMDAEKFASVTRGQFMKVYDGLRRSRETLELMPPELRTLVQGASAPKAILDKPQPVRALPPAEEMPELQELPAVTFRTVKQDPERQPLTEAQWNSRRNQMIAILKTEDRT